MKQFEFKPHPQIGSATAEAYNTRLLHCADPSALPEHDLLARSTLTLLCTILEPHDAPSASMLPARRISDYHVEWLIKLPRFEYVGFVSIENDFYGGDKYYRLWLLADYLSTEAARKRHEEQLVQQSAAWIEERMRWWRLKCYLVKMFRVGAATAQSQLMSFHMALIGRYEESRDITCKLLTLYGFYKPLSTDDRNEYNDAYERAKAAQIIAHAYSSVIDFTGMDIL